MQYHRDGFKPGAGGGLIYFNLTLGLQDNQMRTEVSGRRLAESAESQINHFLVDKRGETTLDALVGAGRQLPLTELENIRELRQVEIFLPNSQRLFSLGTVNSPSLDRQRAINEDGLALVARHSAPFTVNRLNICFGHANNPPVIIISTPQETLASGGHQIFSV